MMSTNPYATKRPVVALPAQFVAQQEREREATMGPQSQRRMTLQQRTRPKFKAKYRKYKRESRRQSTVFGSEAFVSVLHCEICKARDKGLKPKKRAHHKRCKLNRKTKGLSEAAARDYRNEVALKKRLEAPLAPHEQLTIKPTQEDFILFMQPRNTTKKKKTEKKARGS